jgi:hypothetical protein
MREEGLSLITLFFRCSMENNFAVIDVGKGDFFCLTKEHKSKVYAVVTLCQGDFEHINANYVLDYANQDEVDIETFTVRRVLDDAGLREITGRISLHVEEMCDLKTRYSDVDTIEVRFVTPCFETTHRYLPSWIKMGLRKPPPPPERPVPPSPQRSSESLTGPIPPRPKH